MLSFFYSFGRREKVFQVVRRISIFVNLSGISGERCSNERFSLSFSSFSSKESNRFSELQHEFSVLSVCHESEIRDVRIVTSPSYLFPSEDDRRFFYTRKLVSIFANLSRKFAETNAKTV